MPTTALTPLTVLQALPRPRLLDLARELGVPIRPDDPNATIATAVARTGRLELRGLVELLGRDELKAALRAHGRSDAGRSRTALAARLLGVDEASLTAPGLPAPPAVPDQPPRPGDIVRARHRQYFVDSVERPAQPGQATLVRLVCLDDDAQGRRLDVLWELELGAKVLRPEASGLGPVSRVDAPEEWAAYFHALKWSQVTATDARLFQAPFRAGIALLDYQLTPLMKALELPRANLFIADDVGLGKTVEAGLVLSELLLRQRVDFVLVVAPASVCIQWRGELEARFGLRFEVYDQDFVADRRQERGFGVNPWSTHNRFVISYSRLRRSDYLDPLHAHLDRLAERAGGRAPKSLLILDEAHTVAPASGTVYAVDSHVTRVVRDSIAPRFENRLFLSATPHNGHSNSFSALLEILDPQRFTRAVPVTPKRLEPVMVRRLKSDLREAGSGTFPVRRVIAVLLEAGERWSATDLLLRDQNGTSSAVPMGPARDLGAASGVELVLAKKLAEYTELVRPQNRSTPGSPPGRAAGRLVFVNLQKRLLSSVAAFHRTLRAHVKALEEGRAEVSLKLDLRARADLDGDEDLPEDDREAVLDAEVASASRVLRSPEGRARDLLDDMLRLSEQHRLQPDAKVLALLDWIRRHQCPAVAIGGATGPKDSRKWSDKRLIVFTEYGDTRKVLQQLLGAAFEGTERGDERILRFEGGMSPKDRDAVQTAFNAPPDAHPVRVLIATDAAREGLNLQSHCADLFHFDIPWNPARLEQRNGRIDRTLQPSPEVRCHYFVYADRAEDRVLDALVRKTETIQRELGSLSAVVLERISLALEKGITRESAQQIETTEAEDTRRAAAKAELEGVRAAEARLQAEIHEAGAILNASKKVMDFDPELLRRALDVGLRFVGAGPLQRDPRVDGRWHLPDLPASWQETVDTLRAPRNPKEEAFWEWRKKAPRPVVFRAPQVLDASVVHLHLQHPFVQRVLARFLAQGFGAFDLSRVTIVRNRHDHLPRVIAFGRLSLFGRGAARLHDRLVSVAALRPESRGGALKPFQEDADRRAVEMLEQILAEADEHPPVSDVVRERLRQAAPADFAELWKHVEVEADAQEHEARDRLRQRGAAEEAALREILRGQRQAIHDALLQRRQLTFAFPQTAPEAERRQYADDERALGERLSQIEKEIASEPPQLRGLYEVVLRRLEPVGLVYLWPGTR